MLSPTLTTVPATGRGRTRQLRKCLKNQKRLLYAQPSGLTCLSNLKSGNSNLLKIATVEELEAVYGTCSEASLIKEIDHITAPYRAMIDASPFCALATSGPEGLDCTPRGDAGSCARIQDSKTVLLPDRRGNNRIDSLRNIVRDPRIALLFLIPGIGNTLRINGRAELSIDPGLLASFKVSGKPPRSIIVVHVESIYFQCARAVIRAGLWDPANHVEPKSVPTPGAIMKDISEGAFDGETYDREWPERAAKTMW